MNTCSFPQKPGIIRLLIPIVVISTMVFTGTYPAITVNAMGTQESMNQKVIIAHRGASGYLPEHTLAAKVLAVGMGADYVEQDIVLSRDGIPVILHDLYLDAITDVAQAFPERAREDGRFYVIDFDLAELKQLRINERIRPETGEPRYPQRFSIESSLFRIVTLQEEIELIRGLNESMNRNIGLYPEIKSPAWHRQQGYDISRIVLDSLSRHGYTRRSDNIYLQSFDPAELKRIRDELGSDLKLVQLIGENDWNEADTDYDYMRTTAGIQEIAAYADGIGPAVDHIINFDGDSIIITELVSQAHTNNLAVHPYTLRKDNLPDDVSDFDELLELLFVKAGVDGVFTDFPDLVVQYLDRKKQ